jgi:hypothetical protein
MMAKRARSRVLLMVIVMGGDARALKELSIER